MANGATVIQDEMQRPEQNRLERSLGVVLDELYRSWGLKGRARVRFKEMDITSIKDDGKFWKKMVKTLIYSPAEARQLIEAGVQY